jgi:IS30 family transposase
VIGAYYRYIQNCYFGTPAGGRIFCSDRVSHETIYRGLYVLPRGELRRELLACLRQQHQNRWPRSRGQKQRERSPEELRIAARPEEVGPRRVPGHWEGDLLKGASTARRWRLRKSLLQKH